MSYSVYTMPAFVLSARNIGEANRMYTILTRDVGTITATAQSVRLEKSKLRYALQAFSLSEISLVRGKGGWRITNAYALSNLFFESSEENKRKLIIKVSRLLRRLLAGEAPDPELFYAVIQGFEALRDTPSEEVDDLELVIVLKILSTLGYGTDSDKLKRFKEESIASSELRDYARDNRRSLIKEINIALRASDL